LGISSRRLLRAGLSDSGIPRAAPAGRRTPGGSPPPGHATTRDVARERTAAVRSVSAPRRCRGQGICISPGLFGAGRNLPRARYDKALLSNGAHGGLSSALSIHPAAKNRSVYCCSLDRLTPYTRVHAAKGLAALHRAIKPFHARCLPVGRPIAK